MELGELGRRLGRKARALAGRGVSRLLPPSRRYGERSWSQDGEDRILANLFGDRRDGFYVDVGAHHPFRFSNTYLFYRRGWRGLNIDPLPGTRDAFERARPRDISLEMGVAETDGVLEYAMYEEPAYNTFNPASMRLLEERGFPRRVDTRRVRVAPLAAVLDEHLPRGQAVDLLNVDVEGLELQVLRSADWERFRPRAVVLETGATVDACVASEPVALLRARGYELVAKTNNSAVMVTPG